MEQQGSDADSNANGSDCTDKIAESNLEECGPDGRVDALSAVGLILFAVVAAAFWVANQ